MKKVLFIGLIVAALAVLALPTLADTFTYNGYTVVLTPTDPAHPIAAGTIAITGSNERATVDLHGRYFFATDPTRFVVEVAGTITTPEATYSVARKFVFTPQTSRVMWRRIIAWVENIVGS